MSVPILSIGLLYLLFSYSRLQAFRSLEKNGDASSTELIRESRAVNDNPVYLLALGNAYLLEGKTDSANLVLQNATSVSPDKEIYYRLAGAQKENGNFVEAEKSLLFVSQVQPSLLMPKYLLAKLYLETKQGQKWREMAEQVLLHTPKVMNFDVAYMKDDIRNLLMQNTQIE